jgi:hypothetical protein
LFPQIREQSILRSLWELCFASKEAGTKKNLAVKVLWKIIRQIKGFTLLIQIISFNFADIKKRAMCSTTGPPAEGRWPKANNEPFKI